MKLKVIQTTANCDTAACPTIYQKPDGSYIFQGFKVAKETKNEVGVPDNEDLIELPKEFVEAFLNKK